ncbi:hypothetical protein RUM43_010018 [Polyplax serrata]|uniref:Equilibrative nucleoside transporter 3 n=1 Tax=Polyplax serrata TaxID=468196 RepID=A0AAN8S7T7_POLSC
MEYSINASKRHIFGSEEIISEDEEHLLDDENVSDGENNEPSVIYRADGIRDLYKFGYITFYLLGILTLLPWNFFATATDYWMYKFRNIDSNSTHGNKTDLQAEFTSYLSITSTGPSLLFLILNIIFSHRISFHIRITGSIVIIFICFLLTFVLVYVDTDTWQSIFFVVTLLTAAVMNIFSGLLQASLWGVAANFPPKYIAALTSGQSLGAIFAALVCIASLVCSTSSTTSALLYFSIAIVTVLASLICYKVLSLTKFFKYYMLHKTPAKDLRYDPVQVNQINSAFAVPNISLSRVLQKVGYYCFSIFMCFTVTASVYPAITVLISSVNGTGEWQTKYFVPVVSFLIFNIWDYIGRILAGVVKWVSHFNIVYCIDYWTSNRSLAACDCANKSCHFFVLLISSEIDITQPVEIGTLLFRVHSARCERRSPKGRQEPIHKDRLIILFTFLRVIFVPLILLCNANPRQNLPVLIDNDSYYIAIICTFGFTNGYLTNILMINYRSAVDDSEKDVASSLMAVCLALGCATGSAFSFLLLKVI